VGPARTVAPELARADNPLLRAQGARLEAMLLRHEALVPCAWEDPRARARAWHAVWTAEAVVEPLAAPRPTLASVRAALSAVVEAVRGVEPVAVTAPLHRDSEVLARALALLLGVPFAREPASGPSVAVAWDAASLAPGEGARLRADGRALYVHASRGVEEPASEAHLVGCLSGPWRAPWGHDGEVLALVGEPAPPRDARPLAAIAADVAATSASDLADEQAWRRLVGTLAALPRAARTPARVAPRDRHGADNDGLGESHP
jgi:hypothetical protein